MNIQGSFWDACAGQSQFKVRVRQNATVITTNVAKDVPNGGRTIIDDITVLLDQGKDGGRFGSC
jgi:hypothetical protein